MKDTILTPEEMTIASEIKQPYWAEELTHSFAEKALNEQRKKKQFNVELAEHMRKFDEQIPHRGGVIPPHRNIFVGGVTRY